VNPELAKKAGARCLATHRGSSEWPCEECVEVVRQEMASASASSPASAGIPPRPARGSTEPLVVSSPPPPSPVRTAAPNSEGTA
jgi:hypothetical protein